ncbi:hypothetical protein VaNZ11_016120, partial [Volvox africanus]
MDEDGHYHQGFAAAAAAETAGLDLSSAEAREVIVATVRTREGADGDSSSLASRPHDRNTPSATGLMNSLLDGSSTPAVDCMQKQHLDDGAYHHIINNRDHSDGQQQQPVAVADAAAMTTAGARSVERSWPTAADYCNQQDDAERQGRHHHQGSAST